MTICDENRAGAGRPAPRTGPAAAAVTGRCACQPKHHTKQLVLNARISDGLGVESCRPTIVCLSKLLLGFASADLFWRKSVGYLLFWPMSSCLDTLKCYYLLCAFCLFTLPLPCKPPSITTRIKATYQTAVLSFHLFYWKAFHYPYVMPLLCLPLSYFPTHNS